MNFFPDIIIVMPLLCLLLLLSSCDTDTTLQSKSNGDKLMLHVLQMNITSQCNKPSEIKILSNNFTLDHFNSIITVSLSE